MKLKQCDKWGTDNLPLTLASRAVHHLELFNDQQHWKSLCQPRSTHGYLCLEILHLLLAYYIIMIILLKLPIDSYFLVVSVLLLSVSLLSIDCITLIFLKSVYDYFSNFPLIFLPSSSVLPKAELANIPRLFPSHEIQVAWYLSLLGLNSHNPQQPSKTSYNSLAIFSDWGWFHIFSHTTTSKLRQSTRHQFQAISGTAGL
jgi:hypothetical protein